MPGRISQGNTRGRVHRVLKGVTHTAINVSQGSPGQLKFHAPASRSPGVGKKNEIVPRISLLVNELANTILKRVCSKADLGLKSCCHTNSLVVIVSGRR